MAPVDAPVDAQEWATRRMAGIICFARALSSWRETSCNPGCHPRVTVAESVDSFPESPIPAETSTSGGRELGVLLDRVRRRDQAAARALVERLHPVVAKVVHAHLPRREEPEDLFQEIYMKVFSKLEQYRGDAPFEHWVGRIARTTCFDKLRRQKVRPEWRWSDLSDEERAVFERSLSTPGEPPSESAEAARLLVERVLEQLPARDAWLIRSVDLEERPFEAICAEMHWNTGAGRVRLFRARQRLKRTLEKLPKDRIP